eukprot:9394747-Alexandrium_andersonii.AAC.1
MSPGKERGLLVWWGAPSRLAAIPRQLRRRGGLGSRPVPRRAIRVAVARPICLTFLETSYLAWPGVGSS